MDVKVGDKITFMPIDESGEMIGTITEELSQSGDETHAFYTIDESGVLHLVSPEYIISQAE